MFDCNRIIRYSLETASNVQLQDNSYLILRNITFVDSYVEIYFT